MTMGRSVLAVMVVAACGGDERVQPAPDAADPDAAIVPDASIPPDASLCATLDCDDRDPCTADGCDPVGGCHNVALDRCAEPTCSLGACAGPDTDGDGLSDAWETQGYVDIDCNGQLDAAVDLELPGADPDVLDVYLEYDFMVKPGAGTACSPTVECAVPGERCVDGICTHTHDLDPAAVQAVLDAFTAHGVALHLDPVHDAIPESAVVTFYSLDPACAGNDAVSFWALKDAYFDPRRRWVYRYAVLGHHHTCTRVGASCSACPDDPVTNLPPSFGSAGIAELLGNDFIVALGYRDFELALPATRESAGGTFMHELGHTLDLRHGGGESTPDLKPNYLSVMGAFLFTGIPYTATAGTTEPIIGRRIDYSGTILPTLDENALDESAGLGAGTTDVVWFQNGQGLDAFGAASGPIDWDGDGTIDPEPVTVDINTDAVTHVPLRGWSDWPTACTSDDDCPLRPPALAEHVPCVNQRCATLVPAFQCTLNGTSDGPGAWLLVPPEHSVCR